jgi:hypothetical protein
MPNTTTSRRAVLAGLAAAPVAAVPAVALPGADAEVLRLYREFAEAHEAQEAAYTTDEDTERFLLWEDHYLARENETLHALLNEPARTIEGIKAKARAILDAHFDEGVDDEWEVLMHDILAVRS